jgi:hypothetical protein
MTLAPSERRSIPRQACQEGSSLLTMRYQRPTRWRVANADQNASRGSPAGRRARGVEHSPLVRGGPGPFRPSAGRLARKRSFPVTWIKAAMWRASHQSETDDPFAGPERPERSAASRTCAISRARIVTPGSRTRRSRSHTTAPSNSVPGVPRPVIHPPHQLSLDGWEVAVPELAGDLPLVLPAGSSPAPRTPSDMTGRPPPTARRGNRPPQSARPTDPPGTNRADALCPAEG